MPELIQGDATKPVATTGAKTRVAISATTNATPIQVTTKTVHGFFSGDSVELEGTGIAAIDPSIGGQSLYVITVIDTLNFTLNGSTAPGSTASTGYCINYEVQPAFQIPNPGELASMRDLAPIFQGQANAIPYAYRNAGKYRIYNFYVNKLIASPTINMDPYNTAWSTNTSFSAGSNFLPLTGVSLDYLLNNTSGSAAGPVVVAGTDVLDVEYDFSIHLESSTTVNVTFQLYAFPGLQSQFRAISHVTAATPAQVTTATAHGLSTNDFVGIFGNVLGPVGAINNLWQITKIDNFNYTLNGSATTGTSGASGTAVSIPAASTNPLVPSNWPRIGIPTTATAGPLVTPMIVRGILGAPLIPSSIGAAGPSALYWFGLYVTPENAALLTAANFQGPAMCRVMHMRVNG
jgi:hypothetical protein